MSCAAASVYTQVPGQAEACLEIRGSARTGESVLPRTLHSEQAIFMLVMPDFIHTLDEWIIWLLSEEFHGSATIAMITQRTGYQERDILDSIGSLERMKAVRVVRNPRNAMIIDSIGLVPPGRTLAGQLRARMEQR